jgi:uncharacterized protein (DUF433 family)
MSCKIVNGRIDGTRISVWAVLNYLDHGCTADEICRWLPITEEQLSATVEYIEANREYVMQVHRQIEDRNARGNSPDVEAKLKRTEARMQQWLRDRRHGRN